MATKKSSAKAIESTGETAAIGGIIIRGPARPVFLWEGICVPLGYEAIANLPPPGNV